MNTKTDAVTAWLEPRLPASLVDLHTDCRKAGYSLGDLRDAGRALGVATVPREGKELWFLPGLATQPQSTALAPAIAPVAPVAAPAQVPRPSAQLSPEAARAELARRQAILACPEATGREGLAMHTADRTSMTVDEARAMMAASAIAEDTEEVLVQSILTAGRAAGIKSEASKADRP